MDLLVDFEDVADVALLLLFVRDFLVDDDAEVGQVELGEKGVTVEVRRDLGQVDPVQQVRLNRGLVDLRPADDPSNLADVRVVGEKLDGILKPK